MPAGPLYAVIDIGTVTCRFLLVSLGEGKMETLARGYAICNLGVGVDATGYLSEEAIARVCEAVEGFLAQRDEAARAFGVDGSDIPLVCVATSASRDAKNGDEFRARLKALGVEVSIIPGETEAALSFAGASLDYEGKPVLVIDTGGGSTEIIAGTGGGAPQFAHSFNVGCRRLTERYFHHDPPAEEEIAAARAWVAKEFAPFVDELRQGGFEGATVVAVAGTATSVVSVDKALVVYDSAQVHGATVTRETLRQQAEMYGAMEVKARRGVVGLDPKRADVILAGVLILDVALELLGAEGYTASEQDLMQGATLALARDGHL